MSKFKAFPVSLKVFQCNLIAPDQPGRLDRSIVLGFVQFFDTVRLAQFNHKPEWIRYESLGIWPAFFTLLFADLMLICKFPELFEIDGEGSLGLNRTINLLRFILADDPKWLIVSKDELIFQHQQSLVPRVYQLGMWIRKLNFHLDDLCDSLPKCILRCFFHFIRMESSLSSSKQLVDDFL